MHNPHIFKPPEPLHPLAVNEAVLRCDFPLPTAFLLHQENRSGGKKRNYNSRLLLTNAKSSQRESVATGLIFFSFFYLWN